MSFWCDLFGDVKKIVVLNDDVRRLESQVERLSERMAQQGERIARIEGAIGWARTELPPPRLPSR